MEARGRRKGTRKRSDAAGQQILEWKAISGETVDEGTKTAV